MIEFFKMSGSGNDFILMDDRDDTLPVEDLKVFARMICERKVSVGADGLIVIKKSDRADFRWRFFNADGSEAEMCGNGGRCAARYAYVKGIAGERLSFETLAGVINAEVKGKNVKLRMTEPTGLKADHPLVIDGAAREVHSINTGVPHAVYFTEQLEDFDVFGTGRKIRYHDDYQPAGTNANFVKILDRHTIRVRTYERGVEDETLACGTGAVASALVSSWKGWVDSPVEVLVQSGERLRIYFTRSKAGFKSVYLEGGAKIVYRGVLCEEAFERKENISEGG